MLIEGWQVERPDDGTISFPGPLYPAVTTYPGPTTYPGG